MEGNTNKLVQSYNTGPAWKQNFIIVLGHFSPTPLCFPGNMQWEGMRKRTDVPGLGVVH